MDEESAQRLWRQTFAGVAEGFDPKATYRPDSFALGATYVPPAPSAAQPPPPEAVEEIARGGMGIIYRARQESLHREIALKVPIAGVGAATRERFLAEALVTARLAHPNIVPIYDLISTSSGEPALAMKLIGGVPWSVLLHPESDEERRDLEFHLEVLINLANAVAFAHSNEVIHNDLKPDNVMVGEFGEVLLMDWGLAVDLAQRPSMAMPCGTPSYMPPELATGDGEKIGPATDVYLLGAILHEILTGKPPHSGGTLADTLRSVLESKPPLFPGDVPEPLQRICRRALSRDPKQRHPSAPAFQEAIREFLRHRESMAIAQTALENGDLGVAASQAAALDPSREDVRELVGAIHLARERRKKIERQARIVRRGLVGAVVALTAGLAFGLLAVGREHRRASASSALAEARLADIRRLADVKRLADLTSEQDDLWPSNPDTAPRMAGWLTRASQLLQRLPGHRAHLAAMSPPETEEERWEHETLSRLVSDLERFRERDLRSVEARLDFARNVKRRTIDEQRDAWARAAGMISASPGYRGLRLSPQIGLIPLGMDPESGLWEFVHLESGTPPVRGADGRLVPDESMGVVLVLLPGNGGVTPFFIGKYEVTQGQWLRLSGSNTSAFPPGTIHGGRRHTLLHPVEQLSWDEAERVLGRAGLALPSEAQWEHAARAGTATAYWTGESETSLSGAANVADVYAAANGGPASWRYSSWLDDGYLAHAPVGLFRANGFGLHDVAGNVWEWCHDRVVESELPRVFRGGGFRSAPDEARSGERFKLYSTDYRSHDLGVRAARRLD